MDEGTFRSRHKLIAELGLCPDCEIPLVAPRVMAWPHETCSECGARYLADEKPGYKRLIQSFPTPGRIQRKMSVDLLYDRPSRAKESA